MSPQLAECTGFSHEDAEKIKEVLPNLFEEVASSARPEGSISIEKVLWWQHKSKSGQYSSAKVHRTLTVYPNGSYQLNNFKGLYLEIFEDF